MSTKYQPLKVIDLPHRAPNAKWLIDPSALDYFYQPKQKVCAECGGQIFMLMSGDMLYGESDKPHTLIVCVQCNTVVMIVLEKQSIKDRLGVEGIVVNPHETTEDNLSERFDVPKILKSTLKAISHK